jgi:hypothetical protein
MIDCGIIGFGKMGKIRAKAIEDSGQGRAAAIYDISPPDDSPTGWQRRPRQLCRRRISMPPLSARRIT